MSLVRRNDKLAFYGVKSGETETFRRMRKFTDISISKNPREYSRQYVDEDFEQVDVVGYSPSIAYGFDQHEGDAVHRDIATVHDKELLGTAAIRTIIIVDFTEKGTAEGTFLARKRDFSVIPDSEGDSTDAYTYSGTLRAKSVVTEGTATTTDGWATCTFTDAE